MHVKTIREKAVREMKGVCMTHLPIMMLIAWLQALMQKQQGTMLRLSLVMFLNVICLSERVWRVQLRTMIYWSTGTQIIFIASRILIVVCILLVAVCVVVRMLLAH